MTSTSAPPAADRPAHYRLKTETWALVMKEYVEGATAPFLARKWRVSEHAVRRRITQHGATKRDWGDAQAISQAVAREAELEEARRNGPEAVAARLFDGVGPLDEAEAADPGALMRTATVASGRAMTGRLWSEAKALAGLAESYARLAEKGERGGGGSVDTVDLRLLYEIVMNEGHRVEARFGIDHSGRPDPDEPLKRAYWASRGEGYRLMRAREEAHLTRAIAAERALKALGGEPPPLDEATIAAARESLAWMMLTDAEIEEATSGRGEAEGGGPEG